MNDNVYDLIVVGGGPAGIMTALTAKEKNPGFKVCLLESQSSIGKKLSITGGGRCNFTNAIDISDFFEHIVRNNKFLYSSLYSFTNNDLIEFIKRLGFNYVIEKKTSKVYLEGKRAVDFSEALYIRLRKLNIDVFTNREVEGFDLMIEENNPDLVFKDNTLDLENNNYDFNSKDYLYEIMSGSKKYVSRNLVLATGGKSYPQLGSNGKFFEILRKKGIEIEKPVQALSPILIKESYFKDIPGISLQDICISAKRLDGKKKSVKSISGDIVFTHKGIGGPAALKISSYINRNTKGYFLEVDFIPDMSKQEIRDLILKNRTKTLFGIMKKFFPSNFLKAVLINCESVSESGFGFTVEKAANISNYEIEIFIDFLKCCVLSPFSLEKIERSTITSGGVSTKEIDSSTMELKKFPGLFVVGEMIDVDALTGGFNLQIAFSTGYLAGINVK
ncbi:MAG: aminoacetone oxidase family FAD-binding enzyme [Peptostreptococcus porci]|uniref:Aminoacetone oxidase family FAD-binding enzyme n=1 Tax=Peptostreptococcus porci TaxID=2652282 RepID=A0A6N7XHE1_9FIRM|nr:aminoacetone oxidase family FAD-binding enzyme [Peptostreptococcus porci]MDY5480412.1 aminoacetone oxidase family FAD-binding enzyme [Peptostreptococcus porci]MST63033.1 aminoacetone oxidase family FAD-binding enzyme [Peptostreptococcus porci]